MGKPILCLDFDGVLHSYVSGWKGPRCIPDPPVDGAIRFLLSAQENFDVAIHSSRSRYLGGKGAIKRWLRDRLREYAWWHFIPRGQISDAITHTEIDGDVTTWAREVVSRISFPRWKPAAMVTLDDRALTFAGAWPSLDELLNFKPWYKQ